MLKNLFISKVRIKVLEQFFLNPNQEYHVRGMVRILDEEINAIRRELLNLQSVGLLKTQKKGNKIDYTLNLSTPYLDELRGLVLKNSEIGKSISKIAKESGKPDAVILSSSYFSKEYENSSDVDILFIGQFDIRKLGILMKEYEAEAKREFKYSAITIQDFDFGKKKRSPFIVSTIERDFVILYGSFRRLML